MWVTDSIEKFEVSKGEKKERKWKNWHGLPDLQGNCFISKWSLITAVGYSIRLVEGNKLLYMLHLE